MLNSSIIKYYFKYKNIQNAIQNLLFLYFEFLYSLPNFQTEVFHYFALVDNNENFTGVGKKKMRPKKYIKIDKDACLITNFEVDDAKDLIDERNGVKIYGGGVRGIRALKQDKEDDE